MDFVLRLHFTDWMLRSPFTLTEWILLFPFILTEWTLLFPFPFDGLDFAVPLHSDGLGFNRQRPSHADIVTAHTEGPVTAQASAISMAEAHPFGTRTFNDSSPRFKTGPLTARHSNCLELSRW